MTVAYEKYWHWWEMGKKLMGNTDILTLMGNTHIDGKYWHGKYCQWCEILSDHLQVVRSMVLSNIRKPTVSLYRMSPECIELAESYRLQLRWSYGMYRMIKTLSIWGIEGSIQKKSGYLSATVPITAQYEKCWKIRRLSCMKMLDFKP